MTVAIAPTEDVPDSPVTQVQGSGIPVESQEHETPRDKPEVDLRQANDQLIPEDQESMKMPLPPGATGLHEEHGTEPVTGDVADEIPGPAPETSVPMPREVPHEPMRSAGPPDTPESSRTPALKRPILIAIALIVVAMLVLTGGVILLSHYLQDYGGNISGGIVPSVVTATQTPAPVPIGISPPGFHIDVNYPGTFTGTIGNPGLLHQVSGTGNRTFSVLMTTDIIQATILKQDNSGNALTVGIYNNSTLLAEKTITAPMGEINLLIDTKTSNPPGMLPDTRPAGNSTMVGNGTLVYY